MTQTATQAAIHAEISKPQSLFEDWKLRRNRIEAFRPPIDRKLIDGMLSVLDHLIERHSVGSEALHPARFPISSRSLIDQSDVGAGVLFINRRAMVLHHHFRHTSRTSASNAQLGQRVVPVVRRMARRRPRPVRALYDEATARHLDSIPIFREVCIAASVLWNSAAEYVLWFGELINSYAKASFAPRVGPEVDDEMVAYLTGCTEKPHGSAWLAVGLLQCVDNSSVVDYGVAAWRARLMKRPPDVILKMLEDALCQSSRRRKTSDKIRAELASEHVAVRQRALVMLEKLGNLDDINLLLDLACLPVQNDEAPDERDALLRTMWELSGFSGWHSPLGAQKVAANNGGGLMNSPVSLNSVNLYDDWSRRRKRLSSYSGPIRRKFVEGERQVLDFLLEYFKGLALSKRPPRFPMPGEVFADRRAAIIFHHLGKSEFVGVKTEQEATKRASLILRRMASMDLQKSAKNFSDAGAVQSDDVHIPRSEVSKPPSAAQLDIWARIEEELAIRGPKVHSNLLFKKLDEALELGPTLPEKGVYYLSCQIANPDAVRLLSRCDNKTAVDYALGIWRRRVEARRTPSVRKPQAKDIKTPEPPRKLGPSRLVQFFRAEERREQVAEKFRREILTADDPRVRVNAIRVLGRTGTLDDISLLSDVLSLPRSKNEDPRERFAILQAMRRLAGMPARSSTEK
jgi:hypothetical protein